MNKIFSVICLIFLSLIALNADDKYGFNDKWKFTEFNIGFNISAISICFADSLNGMLGANYPSFTNPCIVRTTDCGLTWEKIWQDSATYKTDSATGKLVKDHWPYELRDMEYPDTNLCIALASSRIDSVQRPYIIRSTDKGKTFSIVYLPKENISFNKIKMFNKDTGMVAGGHSVILITFDGGLHWEPFEMFIDLKKASFSDIAWPEKDNIIIYALDENRTDTVGLWTPDGYILRTDDFGKTWEKYKCSEKQQVWSFYFIDNLYGWFGSYKKEGDKYYNIINNTSDGGKTWNNQLDTFNNKTNQWANCEISFYDRKYGIAAGYRSDIWLTSNGGKTWIDQAPRTPEIKSFFGGRAAYALRKNIYFIADAFNGTIAKYTGDPVGVKETKINMGNGLKVFPNPAISGDPINVSFPLTRSSNLELKIYNSLGKLMEEPAAFFRREGSHTLRYSLESNFPSGVYYINIVIDKAETLTGELVIIGN